MFNVLMLNINNGQTSITTSDINTIIYFTHDKCKETGMRQIFHTVAIHFFKNTENEAS